MWRIEFESGKFLPFLPEQAQANPGVYGFELAAWLAEKLAARGVAVTYPLCEDWGWWLDYVEEDFEFDVGCSSVCGEGEGYKAKPIAWSIFVSPRKSMKQKLDKVAIHGRLQALSRHFAEILEGDGITWRIVSPRTA